MQGDPGHSNDSFPIRCRLLGIGDCEQVPSPFSPTCAVLVHPHGLSPATALYASRTADFHALSKNLFGREMSH